MHCDKCTKEGRCLHQDRQGRLTVWRIRDAGAGRLDEESMDWPNECDDQADDDGDHAWREELSEELDDLLTTFWPRCLGHFGDCELSLASWCD